MRSPFPSVVLTGLLLAPEPPKPVLPPAPGQKRERPELLVKLPDDFVQFARVPDGGRMPRVAVGAADVALLYFKGDGEDAAGDLFLARSADEGKSFGASTRVNSVPLGVALRKGIPSGSIDLDPAGRAHVAWISATDAPAVMYAREVEPGKLEALDLGAPEGLGSSTAIAVDAGGRVYLFHVAPGAPAEEGNAPGVRLWMRRSEEGGGFGEPVAIDDAARGVSPGSEIAAHVDEKTDAVLVLYRTAESRGERTLRDVRLLASDDHGETFGDSTLIERRKLNNDPCARASLVQEIQTSLITWEMQGHVAWALLHRKTKKIDVPIAPRDEERSAWRSRPAAAVGGNEVLMAWLERPADDRQAPASLCWQVWYREGLMPVGNGRAPEPPGTSDPAVVPRAGGGFTILY